MFKQYQSLIISLFMALIGYGSTPLVASAAAISGAQTLHQYRDCSAAAYQSGCINPQTGFFVRGRVTQYFEGNTYGGVSLLSTDAQLGTATTTVQFNGPLQLPTIRQSIDAARDGRISSFTTAVQTYLWTGNANTNLPLTATYDFTLGDNAYDALTSFNSATTVYQIILFDPALIDTSNFLTSSLASYQSGGGRGYPGACGDPGVLGGQSGTPFGTPGTYSVSIDLSMDCAGNSLSFAPGTSFSVWISLFAAANRDGSFESLNTFSVDFSANATAQQRTALTSGLVAIPEPTTIPIAGFGLAILVLLRQRRMS
jgi:hypothetical protein